MMAYAISFKFDAEKKMLLRCGDPTKKITKKNGLIRLRRVNNR